MALNNFKARDFILVSLTICSLVITFSFVRINQNPAFHNFADQREFFGIPNFFNVVSNLPFLVVGLAGLVIFLKKQIPVRDSLSFIILFVSVIAIGFGSAWYHYDPCNASLVWDRIPMTLMFMSYFSIVVGNYVSRDLGRKMLFPMLLLGVTSVCYWFVTEQNGNGDLRPYIWVQFYPMVCIPLIVFLYPTPISVKVKIISVIVVYAMAKIAEHEDESIYNVHHLLSGHSVKHLLAAFSVFLILLTTKGRTAT
jgi:hypothetical protein